MSTISLMNLLILSEDIIFTTLYGLHPLEKLGHLVLMLEMGMHDPHAVGITDEVHLCAY